MRKIESIDDFKNTKISLTNSEDIVCFQEFMFNAGFKWLSGSSEIKPQYHQMYIDEKLRMTGSFDDKDFFIRSRNTQIFLEDVLSACEVDKILIVGSNKEPWCVSYKELSKD